MAELFRKEALDQMGAPGQLDSRLRVVTPRYWLPLAAIGVLLAGAIAWSFLGRTSVHIEGRGILVRSQGIVELRANAVAVVKHVLIKAGNAVRKDDRIAEIEYEAGKPEDRQYITAPVDGMLLDSTLRPGWRIRVGEMYGAIGTFGASDKQLCPVFLKISEGQLAQRGLRAFVVPEVARSAHLGAMSGKVVYVRPVPIDKEQAEDLFSSKSYAELLLGSDRFIEAIVEVPRATRRAPSGELVPVALGTLTNVRIEVEQKAPIAFLFPSLFGQSIAPANSEDNRGGESGSGR